MLLSAKTQGRNDFWKQSKPCLVGIHWIALTEHSQMSDRVSVIFQFFLYCQISYRQGWGLRMSCKTIVRIYGTLDNFWKIENDFKIFEELLLMFW